LSVPYNVQVLSSCIAAGMLAVGPQVADFASFGEYQRFVGRLSLPGWWHYGKYKSFKSRS
jgi:hypothetical protein